MKTKVKHSPIPFRIVKKERKICIVGPAFTVGNTDGTRYPYTHGTPFEKKLHELLRNNNEFFCKRFWIHYYWVNFVETCIQYIKKEKSAVELFELLKPDVYVDNLLKIRLITFLSNYSGKITQSRNTFNIHTWFKRKAK